MNLVLILLNYNDYDTCERYLENIKTYKNIKHIVVVDNASTDGSYDKLLQFSSDKIDVIQSKENLGYAAGNNLGMRYAMKKYNPCYFIISNPDVSFDESVIENLVDVLENNKEIALVAPRMKNNKNSNVAGAWKLPNYFANICKMLILLDKVFGKKFYYKDDYFKGEKSIVDVVSGSFFCTNSKVMKEINYFDENTFLYCEENILAMKLKSKGYKEAILNNCFFNHEHSASIDKSYKSNLSKYKILYKSLSYYNKKYLNIGLVKRILFNFAFIISKAEKMIIGIIR